VRSVMIEMDGYHLSPTQAIPQSDCINALALAGTGEETSTVPAKAKIVMFSATTDFYMKVNATASVPGDTVDGSASELYPAVRRVSPGDVLHLISNGTAGIVTIAYYS